MKNFLAQFFTWWNGQTLGTRFFTWRRGEQVGTDEAGNVYYRERTPPRGGPNGKKERRWVVYNGYAEASAIPPGWHGWMHYRTDEIPGSYTPREWQKPHQPNLTGTAYAYRPPGSILRARPETPGGPDYEAWKPEG